MNKSTPINQLPGGFQQGSFINESQRQIVQNAQNAIGNISMPQNTQQQLDVIQDDDAEIQEALNDVNLQINGNAPPPTHMQYQHQSPDHIEPMMPQMPSQMSQMPQMSQMSQPHMQMQHMPQLPNVPIENAQDIMYMKQMPVMPQYPTQATEPTTGIKQILFRFADDLKLAGVVFLTVFAVHYIPIESYVGKYFAIEKIPYHDTLLRAAVAALIVVLIKNTVLSHF